MDFNFDEKSYTAEQVLEVLNPQLTDSRKEKIQFVVENRVQSFQPVFENIYDRGNISAAMRSAEAFGFYKFHIIEQPDAKFKAANRVTQGTEKWLDINKYDTTTSCIESLKAQGLKVYVTHLEAKSINIDEVDFSEPSALMFGNEKEGISKEALEASDGSVIIPMQGFAQSFNISVAAALSFYHVHQYRKAHQLPSTDLSPEEQLYLKALYYTKSVKNPNLYFRRSN